jgi:chemotaxis protein methyltransferase CheR
MLTNANREVNLTSLPSPSPDEYKHILHFAADRLGLMLGRNREGLIQGRLGRLASRAGARTWHEYINLVDNDRDGHLQSEFVDNVTTHYTFFFREPAHFVYLGQVFSRFAVPGKPFRIWSAAASTGEEIWSIIMTLEEIKSQSAASSRLNYSLLATDVSLGMIDRCRRPAYEGEAPDLPPPGLSPERARMFFDQREGSWRPKASVQQCASFAIRNLVDLPAEREYYAALFCRNVLMYFDEAKRNEVLQELERRVLPGGILFLGMAESIVEPGKGLRRMGPGIFQRISSDC